MKITKITSRHRRDFSANVMCENCNKGDTITTGYEDGYFHNTVLPNMKCKHCGFSRLDQVDLFEHYDLLPESVQAVLNKHGDVQSYEECEALIRDLEAVGYTCDYGLDGSCYDLKKI